MENQYLVIMILTAALLLSLRALMIQNEKNKQESLEL